MSALLQFPAQHRRFQQRPLRRIVARLTYLQRPNPWGPEQPAAFELLECRHKYDDLLYSPEEKPARRRRCRECVKPGALVEARAAERKAA